MERMFSGFSHSLLKAAEVGSLADMILKTVEKTFTEDQFLSEQTAAIGESLAVLQQMDSRTRGSSFTEAVEEADMKRDNIIRGIRAALASAEYMDSADPDRAAAAADLEEILDDYGVDTEAGYAVEDHQIRSFLAGMADPENQNHAVAAGVQSMIDALAAAQDEFEDLRSKQIADLREDPAGSMKEPVGKLIMRIDAILIYLEMKALDHGAQWQSGAEDIQDIITRIMIPARARMTRAAGEEEEE